MSALSTSKRAGHKGSYGTIRTGSSSIG
ncbi:MAG: hypothetical protein JWM29_1209, partial [Solirubrobacterales bacterium]|nr:hypothetical protein [Solirubrobacterales bacterium]